MPIMTREKDGVTIHRIHDEHNLVINNLNDYIELFGDKAYEAGDQVEIYRCPGFYIKSGWIKSNRDGLYVRWCDGAKISGMSISAHATGLYLEWSNHIVVEDNDIHTCGWKQKSEPYNKRPAWQKREGIALDAVQECQILNNRIFDNTVGIAVFSNGGERGRKPSRPALGNLIKGNNIRFNDIGVWLSSRAKRDYRYWDMTREGGKWVFNWKLLKDRARNPFWYPFTERSWLTNPERTEKKSHFLPFRLRSWIVPDWTFSNVAKHNHYSGNDIDEIDHQEYNQVIPPAHGDYL